MTKKITFRFFDVDYSGLTSSSLLVDRLHKKLTSSAKDRMMPINKQESDKSDLISDYERVKNKQIIAGTFLRVVNSREAPIITDEMLEKEQIKVSSINGTSESNEKTKTCVEYFYFCLSDKKLIVTMDSRSTISRFQTYINWILGTSESDESIVFTPMVDSTAISAADIKKITIGESFTVSETGAESKVELQSKIVDIKDVVLGALFSETESLKDLMDANICSANLVIKFSKPRGMDRDEYRMKTAAALLKPLANPEQVSFQSNGKNIKGSQVLKTETFDIECDDNGAILEQAIYQELRRQISKN